MAFNPTTTTLHLKPRGAGKPVLLTSISAYEARQAAHALIQRGLVQPRMKLRALIDLMSSAGILPGVYMEEFLSLNERSLRRYRQKNFLERVLVPPSLAGTLPVQTRYLYTLGMVGIELATLIHGRTPTGYIEAEQDKVSHDVLTNVVYYHLYLGLKPLGYSATLYSRYEATVRDYKGKVLLEPDAMVVLEHPAKARQVFLIEYHHEHFSTRVTGKVLKYETVLHDHQEEWQAQWQTSDVPTMLSVWTHKAVGTGYRKYFENQRHQALQPQGRWLGKPLQAFLDKQTVLLWENLGTGNPYDALLP